MSNWSVIQTALHSGRRKKLPGGSETKPLWTGLPLALQVKKHPRTYSPISQGGDGSCHSDTCQHQRWAGKQWCGYQHVLPPLFALTAFYSWSQLTVTTRGNSCSGQTIILLRWPCGTAQGGWNSTLHAVTVVVKRLLDAASLQQLWVSWK